MDINLFRNFLANIQTLKEQVPAQNLPRIGAYIEHHDFFPSLMSHAMGTLQKLGYRISDEEFKKHIIHNDFRRPGPNKKIEAKFALIYKGVPVSKKVHIIIQAEKNAPGSNSSTPGGPTQNGYLLSMRIV